MPKFRCSYAYDVPCYFNFTVEAASHAEAETLIQAALNKGAFNEMSGNPCHESEDGHRAFASGMVQPHETNDDPVLVHDKGEFSIVPPA